MWNDLFYYCPMNLESTAEAYVINLRAVGLEKEDIKLTLEDDVLVVESAEKPKTGKSWIRHEFEKDHINTRLLLPADTDNENMIAKVEKGILSITIPREAKNSKTILVE